MLLSMLFPSVVDARKSKLRNAAAGQTTFTTPDSTGSVIKEVYKKRSPEEIFEALHSVLYGMSLDMDEYNFDRIHPHLKIIYALYNELRLLAFGDPDSLFDSSRDTVQASLVKMMPLNIDRQRKNTPSVRFDSASSNADSTVIITAEPIQTAAVSALSIAPIRLVIAPVVETDPAGMLKENLLGKTVSSSFTLSWNDTSFSKYLLKFEIVQDSLGTIGWNIVFEKIDKLKNKTVKVHRYFDAGEFMISAQDLVWLTDEVKKSEIEILNYFHAKKREKRDSL
jgi:hypothetical protein